MNENDMANELTGNIIGCAMKVHTKLGFGFLESVYENAMAHELRKANFTVQQQVPVKVRYDGVIGGDFIADIVVNDEIIVELKAVENLHRIHEVQLVNYLNAIGKENGLLFNFGAKSLEFKRKHRLPSEPRRGFGSKAILFILLILSRIMQ